MKTSSFTITSMLTRLGLLSLFMAALGPPLRAEQFAPFSYTTYLRPLFLGGFESVVVITHCARDATGVVEIPATIGGKKVVEIGSEAFANCTGITSIILSDEMETVGANSIYNCTGLTTIHLGKKVQSLAWHTIFNCPSLLSFTVAPGNTAYRSIDGLLYDGFGFDLLMCPPGRTGVLQVPAGTRRTYQVDCPGLTEIHLPASVSEVLWSFNRCTALQSITVSSANSFYSSVAGVLFNRQQTTLVGYPAGRAGDYAIPSGVTDIGLQSNQHYSAFAFCTGLTGITIPEGVVNIWRGAFSGCSGLTSVTLPDSLSTLAPAAFADCTGLSSITVPGGINALPWDVFSRCTGLTSVSLREGITSINGSFPFCTGLTSVSIPASVTRIGSFSFEGCTSLTAISIPASVTSVDSWAFRGCTSLTGFVVPASLTNIEREAFVDCTGLEAISVDLGNPRYASVGGVLFDAAMTTVLLCPEGRPGPFVVPAGVTTINFMKCARLTSVTIPNSVTAIPGSAFYGCTRLVSVFLPEGLASIGSDAFRECMRLPVITIPSTVTNVHYFAFFNCAGLTSINVASGNTSYTSREGLLYDAGGTFLVTCPGGRAGVLAIPDGTTDIGHSAFLYCEKLTSVIFPGGISSVGDQAFGSCGGLMSAVFLGDAPQFGLTNPFSNNAPGFSVYYFSDSAGFTSPVWRGYPSVEISESAFPAAAWLVTHGLAYDTSLSSDPDGDGVRLLASYALDLAPGAGLPAPVVTGETMSLTFYAARPGFTYRAEASTDLSHWTSEGVTQTPPDANGLSTATVPRDGPAKFLRLVLEKP